MRVPAVTATTQPIESAVQKVTSTTIPPYLITPQPLLYGNEVSLKVLHYALDFRSNRAQTADLNLVLELEDQSVFPQVPFQIIMHITHGQAEFVTTEDIKQVARISAKEIIFLKLSDEPIYKVSITAPVTKLVKGEIIALTLRLDSAQ
jgi:hypothetical protein